MTERREPTYLWQRAPEPLPAPELDSITATPVPIDVLLDILAWRRPGGSTGEQALIDTYLMPLDPAVDTYGNLFVTVGDAPSVAFTAHTDTVHGSRNPAVRQKLRLGHDGKMVGVKDSDCLGADDGTGIWVLLNLIKAGVPGLYCFYRDEETGRQGSEWSARHEPDRYASIDIMISFDRADSTDVITHQMGERCCSEEFAGRIAELIDPSGQMRPDPTGSFTDSYSFIHLIPECTNISIGYDAQHSSRETQDLTWASYLVSRLLGIDFSLLPVEREPQDDALPDDRDYALVLEAFSEDIASILEYDYGLTLRSLLHELAQMYCVEPDDVIHFARSGAAMTTPHMTPKDDYAHDAPTAWPAPFQDDLDDDEWDERPGYWQR